MPIDDNTKLQLLKDPRVVELLGKSGVSQLSMVNKSLLQSMAGPLEDMRVTAMMARSGGHGYQRHCLEKIQSANVDTAWPQVYLAFGEMRKKGKIINKVFLSQKAVFAKYQEAKDEIPLNKLRRRVVGIDPITGQMTDGAASNKCSSSAFVTTSAFDTTLFLMVDIFRRRLRYNALIDEAKKNGASMTMANSLSLYPVNIGEPFRYGGRTDMKFGFRNGVNGGVDLTIPLAMVKGDPQFHSLALPHAHSISDVAATIMALYEPESKKHKKEEDRMALFKAAVDSVLKALVVDSPISSLFAVFRQNEEGKWYVYSFYPE